jgi:glycosyltransferase involved in cell wall biosynthesis
MQKINLLFDVSIIVQYMNEMGIRRSGIYFVAYNILRCLAKSPFYKITLLIPPGINFDQNKEVDNFLSSFPTISLSDIEENIFIRNIAVHKEQIRKSRNIFVIIIRLLKILKNILFLHLSKEITNKFKDIHAYFTPIFAVPDIISRNRKIKTFHILYDCIPILKCLSEYSSVTMSPWFSMVLQALNKNTYYFCISECTKNDFLKELSSKLDKNKMSVTPLAASQILFPNYDKMLLINVLKEYGITHKADDLYILSLCNIEPRKNLVFTIKCFIKFIEKNKFDNVFFYIGGGFYESYKNKFYDEIPFLNNYKEKIIFLGYVDDEDKNIIYSNSIFFTFLSQYEGFGMPPLEAMQAGTPVVCSNNSSLPEVVGDAAITIDCDSEEQCIKAFEDLYFNEDLRKHYIEKGLERAKLFSWEKTFDLMSKIIFDVTTH